MYVMVCTAYIVPVYVFSVCAYGFTLMHAYLYLNIILIK